MIQTCVTENFYTLKQTQVHIIIIDTMCTILIQKVLQQKESRSTTVLNFKHTSLLLLLEMEILGSCTKV